MDNKGGVRESRVYILVTIFVIAAIVVIVLFGTNTFTPAYIPDDVLDGDWSENLLERKSGSGLFGFERWSSVTYHVTSDYPANLTVYSIKSLVMLNEKELEEKVIESINKVSSKGININNDTKVTGVRALKNKHKTLYTLYDGNDTSKNPAEKIKIIAEVWNCGISGTSIICIGVAQITDNAHGNPNENMSNWSKIVRDENGMIDGFDGDDGLIYNVVCH